MSSCWRPDPSERPLFPQLREMLEKVAEKLPESSSKDDIIYINTSFPEEDPEMSPAEGPLLNSSPCCSRQGAENSVVTVDVHGRMEDEEDDDSRYVVVISSDRSLRPQSVDTPLLSADAFSEADGSTITDVTAVHHSSSDTSFLLLWTVLTYLNNNKTVAMFSTMIALLHWEHLELDFLWCYYTGVCFTWPAHFTCQC